MWARRRRRSWEFLSLSPILRRMPRDGQAEEILRAGASKARLGGDQPERRRPACKPGNIRVTSVAECTA
jgi:hypothetical protein